MLQELEKDLILNNLPGAAYRCDGEEPWAVTYVSPAIESMSSFKVSDILAGKLDWRDLIHPDDLPAALAELKGAIAEHRPYAITFRILDPTRELLWALNQGQAIYDETGKACSIVGLIIDITEQKLVEQRLRDSEAHHQAALALSRQIPWSTDGDGILVDVSPRWFEMVGDNAGSDGRDWVAALHPDDRDRAADAWQHSLTTGEDLDCRYRLKIAAGDYRWFRACGSALRADDNSIMRWYGTVEDVQAQVEIEDELREAEERYALAARASGDFIWDWNPETNVVQRIAAKSSTLYYPGLEDQTSIGWWEEHVHPDDLGRVQEGVQRLIEGGGDRWADEYRMRRADGSWAHVMDRAFLLRTQAGSPHRVVGATQDISDRVAAEEKLQRLQAELIQLTGMSAMDTMATTLAHELNQPLAAAANYLVASRRLLGRLTGETKEMATSGLQEAESQIHRAGEIIRRVRSMVANRSTIQEQVSLRKVVGRVAKLLDASQSCPGVAIRTHIRGAADLVRADPVQVEQVILNIVRNACQAFPAGVDPEINVSARERGDMVEIAISDKGAGLSQMALENLFTAFVDSTSGGLGVGLSISRTIIEGHGGRIWAQNNPEGGACFYFTLPVWRDIDHAEPRRGAA